MNTSPTPAPARVTLADLDAAIVNTHYFTAREGAEGACGGGGTYPVGLGLLTVCVLTLDNGFTVLGESACVDPAGFNAEVGQKLALEDARRKVWPLLGFALRSKRAGLELEGD